MILSPTTDDLQDEDSFGGEIDEGELTLIIHGFKTDFKHHPLDYRMVLSSLEKTLAALGCQPQPFFEVETVEKSKPDAQKKLDSGIDLSEELMLSPVPVCDRTKLLSPCRSDVSHPLSPCDTNSPMSPSPNKKCMCFGCLGNRHRSRWALVANKTPSVETRPALTTSTPVDKAGWDCSDCAKLRDKPCLLHAKGVHFSGKVVEYLSAGSCLRSSAVSRDLSMQDSAAVDAGIFICSPISQTVDHEKDVGDPFPGSRTRCLLRSVSSSGYGSDIHRLDSCASEGDALSFIAHTNSELQVTQENTQSSQHKQVIGSSTSTPTVGSKTVQDCGSTDPGPEGEEDDLSSKQQPQGADSSDGRQDKQVDSSAVDDGHQSSQAQDLVESSHIRDETVCFSPAKTLDDKVEAIEATVAGISCTKDTATVAAASTPSYPSSVGLDSGLGLGSDPGYDDDLDTESGISEDMGSDADSHLDDLESGPLPIPDFRRRQGKKSTCVGSKGFLTISCLSGVYSHF